MFVWPGASLRSPIRKDFSTAEGQPSTASLPGRESDISLVMRASGFHVPDLIGIAHQAKLLFEKPALQSSMPKDPGVHPGIKNCLLIVKEIGGSNSRSLAVVVDRHGQVDPTLANARFSSLRHTKKLTIERSLRAGNSMQRSVEGMLKTAIGDALVYAATLIRQNRGLPIKFALIVSDAVEFGKVRSGYRDAFVTLPDSYCKPNWLDLAVPDKFNVGKFTFDRLQKRFRDRRISTFVEHDSNLVAAIPQSDGSAADGGFVLCTGLGASINSEKSGGISNAEPGWLIKLAGLPTETVLCRKSADSAELVERTISNAEDICAGDKLIALLNYWSIKLASSSFPELNAIVSRENRFGKRRVISREESTRIMMTGGKIEENLENLRSLFDPKSELQLSVEAFSTLYKIANELVMRAKGVSAAILAGMSGSCGEKDRTQFNIDTTVLAHPNILRRLEEQANVIAADCGYAALGVSFIHSRTVGRYPRALSVPIQGMLSYLGLKLGEH